MRPPNNDALTDYAVAASAVIIASIPVLWITVLLLALASCGAQPAAAEPNYSRNSNSCPDPLADCQSLTDTLRVVGIPYPDVFSRIAWAETQYGTTGVGEVNNLFGMQCADRGCQAGCTDNGYAVYAARIDAVSDLAWWVDYAPPMPQETAHDYLSRRGWQPPHLMPKYWAYLQTLNQ